MEKEQAERFLEWLREIDKDLSKLHARIVNIEEVLNIIVVDDGGMKRYE